MTDLRSEIDYLHSILELLAEIREGLGRIEDRLPEKTVLTLPYRRDLLKTLVTDSPNDEERDG